MQLGYRPSTTQFPKLHLGQLKDIAWRLGLPAVTIKCDESETSNHVDIKGDSGRAEVEVVQEIEYIREDAIPISTFQSHRQMSQKSSYRISVTESLLWTQAFQQIFLNIKNNPCFHTIWLRVIVDRMNGPMTDQTIQQLSVEKAEFAFPYNPTLSEEEEILAISKYLKTLRSTRIAQRSLIPPPKYNWSFPVFNYPEVLLEQVDDQEHDIAVIVPVYNKENVINLVAHALLNQNLPTNKFELNFVDDGSKDKTSELIISAIKMNPHQRNVRLLRMPRPNNHSVGDQDFTAGLARNAAIRYVNSDLLLFLDGDMVASPSLLESHIERQQSLGGAVIMGRRERLIQAIQMDQVSRFWSKNINSLHEYVIPKKPDSVHEMLDHGISWSFIDPNPWLTCASCNVSIPTAALEQVGFFDPYGTLWSLDDTDLFYRLHKGGFGFHYAKDAVGFHCWHPFEGDVDGGRLPKIVTSVMFRKYLDMDILRANAYLFNWPKEII